MKGGANKRLNLFHLHIHEYQLPLAKSTMSCLRNQNTTEQERERRGDGGLGEYCLFKTVLRIVPKPNQGLVPRA